MLRRAAAAVLPRRLRGVARQRPPQPALRALRVELEPLAKRVPDERPVFPHLRIAGCSTCSRYLIEVDMARDGRAVPEVDELAALPLDLYAADQGMSKLTPNLMGF